MKKQISWVARGGEHTGAALDEHAEAIRQLQQQVADLAAIVGRIEPIVDEMGTTWEDLPTALRAAVDDLGDRMGALEQRMQERET